MTQSLLDFKALRERVIGTRSNLFAAAKPKLYKAGRRKGHIRVPGLSKLAYSGEDLWQHALAQVGTGVIRCPYCVAIGKNANLIDLRSFVWDHRIPKSRSKDSDEMMVRVHALRNLVAVCGDCNNLKGNFTFEFFVALMQAINEWMRTNPSADFRDRDLVYACLRTHGRVVRQFGESQKKMKPATVVLGLESGKLPLTEDW